MEGVAIGTGRKTGRRAIGTWMAWVVVLSPGCALDRSGLGGQSDGGVTRVDAATLAEAGGLDGGGEPPIGMDAGQPLVDAGPERDDAGTDTGPADAGPTPGTLRTLRWELPCEPGSHRGIVCTTATYVEDSARFRGDAIDYDVTLHFRGVVEERSISGGSDDGLFNTGGSAPTSVYTTAGVEVSAPAETYFLNSGVSGRGRCVPIDYQRTIRIEGGATVRIWGATSNTASNYNIDESTGAPIVIAGAPPAPAAYDGQFIQVDLISATPR